MSGSASTTALLAVSPIDGRYAKTTECLQQYFSEFAFFKYRVHVEVEYLVALFTELPEVGETIVRHNLRKYTEGGGEEAGGGGGGVVCGSITADDVAALRALLLGESFTLQDALRIKELERETNHDIKAVEYFIKEKLKAALPRLMPITELVHFGLTSQDINNTAIPMMVRDAVRQCYVPQLRRTVSVLEGQVVAADGAAGKAPWDVPMLARTHGQPASPTNLAKEYKVFLERLDVQLRQLQALPFTGKFGGATGNFNAHRVAFPGVDWRGFADVFVTRYLGLDGRQQYTTQIEHYDGLAALCHVCERLHTILVDLCRDTWQYISMGYFTQRILDAREVGSSAMPHKVNPIDFENAEGNFLMSNALLQFIAGKLPVSRLQRDLTDSTVLRNLGVPTAHALIAFSSLQRGLGKLCVDAAAMERELESHWEVIAEAIQTILRREGYPSPYEALKALTRGRGAANTRDELRSFLEQLTGIDDAVRAELLEVTPLNYTGYL